MGVGRPEVKKSLGIKKENAALQEAKAQGARGAELRREEKHIWAWSGHRQPGKP